MTTKHFGNFGANCCPRSPQDKLDAFALASRWNRYVEDAGKEGGVRRRRAAIVLRLLIGLLQDALRLSANVPPLVANEEETFVLRGLTDRIGIEKLLTWIERATEANLQIDRKVQLELIVEAFVDALAR